MKWYIYGAGAIGGPGTFGGGGVESGTFERAAPTSADPKGLVVALMRPVMSQ